MKTQFTATLQLSKTRKAATTFQPKPTKKLILNRETIRMMNEAPTPQRMEIKLSRACSNIHCGSKVSTA
jgi:hypothetical protein